MLMLLTVPCRSKFSKHADRACLMECHKIGDLCTRYTFDKHDGKCEVSHLADNYPTKHGENHMVDIHALTPQSKGYVNETYYVLLNTNYLSI